MTIDEAIQKLKDSQRKIKARSPIALNKIALDLLREMQTLSPTDEGTFKGEWDIKREKDVDGALSTVSVFNRTSYGPVLEEGSSIGSKPWPSAGPKTTEQDGRIWSSQAPGGIASPYLNDPSINFLEYATNAVQDFVFRGIF